MKNCIYCNEEATDRDHFIPSSYCQVSRNYYVQTNLVPACSECNRLKSDKLFDSVQSVKEFLLDKYKERYRKLLSFPPWSKEELEEISYSLRKSIVNSLTKKETIKRKLEFLKR